MGGLAHLLDWLQVESFCISLYNIIDAIPPTKRLLNTLYCILSRPNSSVYSLLAAKVKGTKKGVTRITKRIHFRAKYCCRLDTLLVK